MRRIQVRTGISAEIRRILRPPQALLHQLEIQIGLKLCSHPVPAIIQTALLESWTKDPFDRMIVAQAMNRQAAIVTGDARLRDYGVEIILV